MFISYAQARYLLITLHHMAVLFKFLQRIQKMWQKSPDPRPHAWYCK